MNTISRFTVSLVLIAAFLSNAMPCGPGYITPLFDTTSAPENPYSDFAAGRFGIVKPGFRRAVLYAAYRYIAGSGLNAAEQTAVAEVWKGDIDNKDFRDNNVEKAVKAWLVKRKDVMGKNEPIPDIYVERAYGGYDFFPNCAKNAFETAAETLSDRVSAHGPNDTNLDNWVKAQDQVFQNCASGKRSPDPAPPGAPDWLQKDRAYQMAAASFYSLDYNDAKRRFAEIAQDSESPWQETADYLVARTLIRQASLTKSPERAASYYDEAETHLEKFISRTGKFASSAEGLMGLIRYRRHPKERVSELAKKLAFNGANDNFRQDLIDYNWLLDKFESEVLAEEEKRKEAERVRNNPPANQPANAEQNVAGNSSSNSTASIGGIRRNDDDIVIALTSDDYKQNWTIYVDRNATDEEAIEAAEKVVGGPLTEAMKTRVREERRSGYVGRFSEGQQSGYEGGYYGDEKLTPSLMPDYLRRDDLTDWIFTYQMPGAEAYLYSLSKFRATGSEVWLMSALAKADKSSTGLPTLLTAANNMSRTSPAYITVAYHTARILLAQGKTAEAKRLVGDMLDIGDGLPVSARNSFMGLRLRFAETLEDYLIYSLRKPFAFDFDGQTGTIEEIIAEQKSWYSPGNETQTREQYDAEIDERYKDEKEWQGRMMFDTETIDVFNQHFPTSELITVLRSPALPDYLRERFALAIWTRALLLNDQVSLAKVTPDLAVTHPEFATLLAKISAARSPSARENAQLYFILKNPLLSPYIEDGMGKSDNEFGPFDSNDWWCEPYDTLYNDMTDSEEPKRLPPRPAYLSAAQSQTAQAERKRLKEIGDAPKFLAAKVMEWARKYPTDPRVPEALYIVIEANGWTKYGCGNNEELRDEIAAYLRRQYPGSEWTAKLNKDEAE